MNELASARAIRDMEMRLSNMERHHSDHITDCLQVRRDTALALVNLGKKFDDFTSEIGKMAWKIIGSVLLAGLVGLIALVVNIASANFVQTHAATKADLAQRQVIPADAKHQQDQDERLGKIERSLNKLANGPN